MKIFLGFIKSPQGLIALSVILLVASILLYGLGQNLKSSTVGYEVDHSAIPLDAGVVTIEGEDILDTTTTRDLKGRILNKVYAEHYTLTDKVERQARFTSDLKNTNRNVYDFSISFIPSNDKYDVNVTMNNLKEKNFSITIKQEK